MDGSGAYRRDENGAYVRASSCEQLGRSIQAPNGTDTQFLFCQKCKSDFDADETDANGVAVLCFGCNKDYQEEMMEIPTRGRRSERRRRS